MVSKKVNTSNSTKQSENEVCDCVSTKSHILKLQPRYFGMIEASKDYVVSLLLPLELNLKTKKEKTTYAHKIKDDIHTTLTKLRSDYDGKTLVVLKMDKYDTLIILTPSNNTKNPDEKICRIFKRNLFFRSQKSPANFSIILDLLNKTNLHEYYANKKQDK